MNAGRASAAGGASDGSSSQFNIPRARQVELGDRFVRTVLLVVLFFAVCKITRFRVKLQCDVRINRRLLRGFYLLVSAFVLIYVVLLVQLRWLRPKDRQIPVDDWDKAAPVMMYIATGCLYFAWFAFIFALWPCFKFGTFFIAVIGFLTLIFVAQWLPI
jgi:hypothetical protein